MVNNSDGIFVASPAVHAFVSQALAGVPGNRWYTPPPGVVRAGASWFLTDATSIAKLPGDNPPSPTPTPVNYTVPPDPGTGPVLASPSPSPIPTLLPCVPPQKPPGCI
jgi:hypothetical protein